MDNINKLQRVCKFFIAWKITLLGLGFCLIGSIFLFIPDTSWKTIGMALIPAGLITSLSELFLRRDIIDIFEKTRYCQELISNLNKLGINNVFENRNTPNIHDPIFGSIKNIYDETPNKLKRLRLMGMSLDLGRYIPDSILEDLARRGCSMQFLVLSDRMSQEKEKTLEKPGLPERIESFIAFVNRLKESVGDVGTNIEIRRYDIIPSLHISILNDDRLFVNSYPLYGQGWAFPVIEVEKHGILFEKYEQQFEKVWDIAIPV